MPSEPLSGVPRSLMLTLALTLACAGAANAFSTGEFVTYTQTLWGGMVTNPGAVLLLADYSTVYSTTSGLLAVGQPSPGFSMTFDGPIPVIAYLPAAGTPAPLDQNLLDPLTTSSGSFGGDVLALQLNVDFNNAGFLSGTSSIPLGDLVLQNFSTLPALNGLTVSQFLADANLCLSGLKVGFEVDCIYSSAAMDSVTAALTLSFLGGTPGTFTIEGLSFSADTNLALPVPEPSSLTLLGAGIVGLALRRRRARGASRGERASAVTSRQASP